MAAMPATKRIWWLAATLSMCVPGLGQVYNGQLLRGTLVCLLMAGSGLGTLLWVLMRGALFLWVTVPLLLLLLVHIWIITDATVVARRSTEQYQLRRWNHPAVYTIFTVAVLLLFSLAEKLVVERCFQVWQVPVTSYDGVLQEGDHVLVNRLAFGLTGEPGSAPAGWWRDPEPGEALLYRLPSEPQQLLPGRCLATSGQTVSISSGQVTVDEQHRTYLPSRVAGGLPVRTYQVPEQQLCVLSEQLADLLDPIEMLDRAALVGQPMLVLWSVDQATNAARFDRIGIPVL